MVSNSAIHLFLLLRNPFEFPNSDAKFSCLNQALWHLSTSTRTAYPPLSAPFEQFPQEIYDEISRHLSGEDAKRLCVASRALNRAFAHRKWRNIALRYPPNMDPFEASRLPMSQITALHTLCAIIQRSTEAETTSRSDYIKQADFEVSSFCSWFQVSNTICYLSTGDSPFPVADGNINTKTLSQPWLRPSRPCQSSSISSSVPFIRQTAIPTRGPSGALESGQASADCGLRRIPWSSPAPMRATSSARSSRHICPILRECA